MAETIEQALAEIEKKIGKLRAELDLAQSIKTLYKVAQGSKGLHRRVLMVVIGTLRLMDEQMARIGPIMRTFRSDQERSRRRAEAIEFDRQDREKAKGTSKDDRNSRRTRNPL